MSQKDIRDLERDKFDSLGRVRTAISNSGLIFSQPTPVISWSIPHNFGYSPDVHVYTTGGLEIVANVTHVDLNNIIISFSIAFAGYARLT